MKKSALLIVLMVLVAGFVIGKSFETGYEPAGLDELEKQKGLFKNTEVRTDADFSRYTKIYQRKVMLVVRDPGTESSQTTGSLVGGRGRTSVMPEWDELTALKNIVSDALTAELVRSTDLEQVHDGGPGVLVLRPVITDVVFSTSSKNRSEDGRELPSLSYGTIVFDLIDGETGMIQARMGERRKCRPPKGEEPQPGAWPNAAHWAESAAADFSKELTRLRDGRPTA